MITEHASWYTSFIPVFIRIGNTGELAERMEELYDSEIDCGMQT